MTREPPSMAQTRRLRACRNSLFFNKLKRLATTKHRRQVAAQSRFAETCGAAQNNQQVACAAIARPHGRARIETWCRWRRRWCRNPSPGLTAGRGLKLRKLHQGDRHRHIARPHGRARIETARCRRQWRRLPPSPGLTAGRGLKLELVHHLGQRRAIARPHGRARIETPTRITPAPPARPSPGLTAGRGLKQCGLDDLP